MTSAFLPADIANAEGLRLKAYPDPRSPRSRELAKPLAERVKGWETLPGEPWTCGYGSTKGVTEHTVWTLEQAHAALVVDIADAEAVLDHAVPWWRQLSLYRQDVIAELSFNLGWHTFSKFQQFLGFVDQGRYAEAATDLLASKAARELPKRYARLATQLRTGVRAV